MVVVIKSRAKKANLKGWGSIWWTPSQVSSGEKVTMEGKNTLKEKGFRTRQCERHRDNLQRIQEEEKQVAEGT